jgi:hypothetical protein
VKRWALAALLATVAAARSAAAQDASAEALSWGPPTPAEDKASPRAWALSLRAGRYRPEVDAELGPGPGPYAAAFGGARRWMFGLELERELFQRFGTLSLAGSVAWSRAVGHALRADGDGTSADETSLRLLPLGIGLTWRADFFARTVPVVPYVKAGLDYALWNAGNGDGRTVASGGTAGWHAGAGVALLLDALDPAGALGLDQETGVNHTYLFVEWIDTRLDGLGAAHKLRLGDRAWFAGLMIEM